MTLCECGCGQETNIYNGKPRRFIHGHHMRKYPHIIEVEPQLCECGCGQETTVYRGKPKRFIRGHNKQGKPNTPEYNATMSEIITNSAAAKAAADARRGVPLPPEWCAAISKANKESDAAKTHHENMRGGNDLVKHHHIYDHDDLSKYTIEMTRSQHATLHRNMQLLNLKVPHINTGHKNVEELDLIEYIETKLHDAGLIQQVDIRPCRYVRVASDGDVRAWYDEVEI